MERREIQRDKALLNFTGIVGEIHFHVGAHVEGFEGHPIVGLELVQKYVSPVHGVVQKPAVAQLAEFDEQNHGDGGVGGTEIGDGLWRALFSETEIFLL